MAPFYGWGSTASRLQSHFKEVVYFLPLSSQKVLILIWSTSEGWKTDSTFELPSGFEHRTLGLGIHRQKCPHPIRLQDFSTNHIFRANHWNILIFCMLIQIQMNWKWIKIFFVGMVKNGCDQSGDGTLKWTVSQEWIDGTNQFFAC